jgi:hypothetical protein
MSSRERDHSVNIRQNGEVAGGIVFDVPEGLGSKVRGVTFSGKASELAVESLLSPLEIYLSRWPKASAAISVERVANEDTKSRLYEIRVARWVLFDEVNFPDQPKRVLSGA